MIALFDWWCWSVLPWESVHYPFCIERRVNRWKTDLGPKTRQTLCLRTLTLFLSEGCTQQIFVYTFKSYLGMGKMTVWWGDSRASRFKSPSADVRKWWVSCMWGFSYSQTKLNEEGLIWPECPALLNRTLSLRALLRDNVCFVSQSSERGGWERVEGDGGVRERFNTVAVATSFGPLSTLTYKSGSGLRSWAQKTTQPEPWTTTNREQETLVSFILIH